MSRKTDLEQHIRESYKLIREFEDILRLSDNPKEQARARRAINEQWDIIKGYVAEYVPLCERLGLGIPEDITEIATHFPEYTASQKRLERPRGSYLPMVAIDVRHGARVAPLFVRELETHGFRTKELSAPLTVNSLSDVRSLTLFVALPDHGNQPLTSEEITTVQSFVVYGGGLFLIGLGWDWEQYGKKLGLTMDDYPLNKLSYPQFGIYFRGEPLDDPRSEFEIIEFDGYPYPCAKFDSTSMRQHPVTAEVHRIFSFGMSSTLQVTSPSIPLIWDGTDHDRCVLAAWHTQGQGRVICLQHEGYFKDQNIHEFDNLKLLINIMQWLSQSGETSKVNHMDPTLPDQQPLTSPSSSLAVPKPPFVRAHALLIGVGDYTHNRFASLPATIRDAQAIANVLADPVRCGYLPGNVRVLTGEQATDANIRAALKTLAESTTPESTAFVYFSGHGGRALENGVWRAYLCPREADPDDLAHTAIPGDEFSGLLAAIPARKLLAMLDACHAAGSAELKAADGTLIWKTGLPDTYYEALSQGSGRVVIASSKEDQYSYVRPQGDLSLFTHHLREALGGKAAVRGDGLIHVLDVFHYVNEAVHADESKQTPILKVKDLDLNFSIALALGGKVAGPAISITPIADIRERIVRDPIAGAKALSEYLATRPEWAAKRNEADLKRADLERIQHDLDLFGPNPSDQAAKNRAVYFLLRVCLELERPGRMNHASDQPSLQSLRR